MKTLIKIDLDSIKRNENAGSTQTIFPVCLEFRFECEKLPKYLVDGENCYITTSQETDLDLKNIFTGVLSGSPELIDGFNLSDFTNIEIEQHAQTVNHLPIPEYSFQRENGIVTCSECGKNTNYFDIQSIHHPEYEIDNEICAYCRTVEPFDYEYESIEDALKRKGK
ncbi:MAG TPA: hypothetical protein VIH28_08535 [Ignavibacteriaceae bacterium]